MKKIITFLVATIFMFIVSNTYSQWERLGPYGARVTAFVQKNSYLFCGTYGYGVYKSTNGGMNWIQSSSGLTNLIVEATVVYGEDLYAGTYDGMFKSTNYGQDWFEINNGISNNTNILTLYVNGIKLN